MRRIFLGQNIFLVTLEYRYKIHPDFQALIFFDEGQVFGRTTDRSWLNWQRNYGFGFKVMSSPSTIVRMDFGWNSDGYTYHISWGDRMPRTLGGAIRYGTYRRTSLSRAVAQGWSFVFAISLWSGDMLMEAPVPIGFRPWMRMEENWLLSP